MITVHDLQEAIAECKGQRDPNANTCIKLAAYYTILREMSPPEPAVYSAAPGPDVIQIDSGTEFAERATGMDRETFLSVMDELMETIRIVNPPLYRAVLRKLS